MTDITQQNTLPATPAVTGAQVAAAIAKLLDGHITPEVFQAETGLDAAHVPIYLGNPEMAAAVQRIANQRLESGESLAADARSLARRGLQVAGEMLEQEGLSPTVKLGAATLLARAAGAFDGGEGRAKTAAPNIKISINFGAGTPDPSKHRVVVATGAYAGEDDGAQRDQRVRSRRSGPPPVEGEFTVSPERPPEARGATDD